MGLRKQFLLPFLRHAARLMSILWLSILVALGVLLIGSRAPLPLAAAYVGLLVLVGLFFTLPRLHPLARPKSMAGYFKKMALDGGIGVGMLMALELLTPLTSPAWRLPADGPRSDHHYTWGHIVIENKYGFRERDFVVPKPTNTYRVMVLGDSITWGAGVAPTERYTNVAEQLVNAADPGADIEIINFGLGGGDTKDELGILEKYIGIVEPNLLVVGFNENDPEPPQAFIAPERLWLEAAYSRLIGRWLEPAHLISLNSHLQRSFVRLAVALNVIPTSQVEFDRRYQYPTPAWHHFETALRDIKRISDTHNLPAPFFIVLNLPLYTDQPTDYVHPNGELRTLLQWNARAEESARRLGFRTYNHVNNILQEFPFEILAVNALDRHPDPRLHYVYARRLAQVVRAEWHAVRLPTTPP